MQRPGLISPLGAPWRRALIGVWAAACGLAPQFAAAEAHPYSIGLTETVGHDNNLLRLADGQDIGAPYRRADTITTSALQGTLDQPFGRQRFSANLSLRDVRYRNNSLYNNQGYTGGLFLDWSTAERISGSLSATGNRSLSSFSLYQIGLLAERNYEDTRGFNVGLNVGLVTQYSLEFSGGYRDVVNTLQNDLVQARNFQQNNANALLRWRPSSATNLALGLHETRGRYPRFQVVAGQYQADRYKQDQFDLSGNVVLTGASTVDFRIGNSRTSYDLNQARSFSGVIGTLGWAWQPTGKLRINSRLTRDTGQDSYAVTVFGNVPGSSDLGRVVTTARIDLGIDQSPKLSWVAGWQQSRRDLVQVIVNPLLPLNASGRDTSTVLNAGVRWAPLRTVQLGCDLNDERRTATGSLISPLHSHAFSCYGQLQFQP